MRTGAEPHESRNYCLDNGIIPINLRGNFEDRAVVTLLSCAARSLAAHLEARNVISRQHKMSLQAIGRQRYAQVTASNRPIAALGPRYLGDVRTSPRLKQRTFAQ